MDGPKSRRFEGRAAFIAQLAAIRAEVKSGVSLTSIYDTRKAALGIGYRYFHQLVARHIGLARDRFSDRAKPPPAQPTPTVQQEPPKSPVVPSASSASSGAVAPQDETPTENENSDGPKAAPRPRRFQPHKGPAKRGDLW